MSRHVPGPNRGVMGTSARACLALAGAQAGAHLDRLTRCVDCFFAQGAKRRRRSAMLSRIPSAAAVTYVASSITEPTMAKHETLGERTGPQRAYVEEFRPLFSGSPAMQMIGNMIEDIADTDATTLILGESGVGKDVVARAIHAASTRYRGPFIKVNCAALPAELLESELFGHEKGAFTGAYQRKLGQFECATWFTSQTGFLLTSGRRRFRKPTRYRTEAGVFVSTTDRVRWTRRCRQCLVGQLEPHHGPVVRGGCFQEKARAVGATSSRAVRSSSC
jgi:hypothetical protein